jgi:hypothetical protein
MTLTKTKRRLWRDAVRDLGFEPDLAVFTLVCDYNDHSAALKAGDEYHIDGHLYRIVSRDIRLTSNAVIFDLVESVVYDVAEWLVESREAQSSCNH